MTRALPWICVCVLALAGCGDNETAPQGFGGDGANPAAGDGGAAGDSGGEPGQGVDLITQPLCAGTPFAGVLTGAIDRDTALVATESPYDLQGRLSVADGATLCIEPGVSVRAGSGAVIEIGDGGALVAVGLEARPIVLTSGQETPRPGDWQGLSFTAGALGDVTRLEHVVIEYAGAPAVAVRDTDVTLERVTLRKSEGAGLELSGEGEPSRLVELIFEDNGAPSFAVDAARWGDVGGGHRFGADDCVEVRGGAIESDLAVPALSSPYCVSGDVVVAGGDSPVLTLSAGVTARFGPGVVLRASGLKVQGTADEPVTLTAWSTPAQAGDWGGVHLTAADDPEGSALRHTWIEYAGGQGAALLIEGQRPAITDVTIRYSSDLGAHFADAVAGARRFVGNRFDGIAEASIRSSAGRAGDLDAGFEADGAGDVVEVTAGRIVQDVQWPSLDTPWRLLGKVSVSNEARWTLPAGATVQASAVASIVVGETEGAALTIGEGVLVRFDAGAGLYVGRPTEEGGTGDLVLLGTPEAPVRFTPAATEPEGGMWRGIALDGGASGEVSRLEHFVVEFGGQGIDVDGVRHANLVLKDTDVHVRNAEVRGSTGFGIEMTGGTPTLSDITYEGNQMGDWVRWN